MMKGKRWFLILTAVALLLTGASVSYAEEDVKVEVVSVDPTELSEAGLVTATFEISNHSDYELSGITISQGALTYEAAQGVVIPRFGSAKIPVDVQIADSQIGLPVVFTVGWSCAGEPFFANVEITIARAADPTITVQRTVSAQHARQGETLTITYTLKNETKFDMTDITLIDDQVSNEAICRNETLRANATYTFEYACTMGTQDVVTSPVVTYTVNGKTKSFSSIEPITLSMVNVDVRLEVEAGTPAATSVKGTPVAAGVPASTSKRTSTLTMDSVMGSIEEKLFVLPLTV